MNIITKIKKITLKSAGGISILLLMGTANSIEAQNGEALNFDGSNDRVTVPNTPTINFGLGDFSIEAKVKTTASNPNFAGIVEKDASASPLNGWQLLSYTNSIALEVHSPAGSLGVGNGLVGTSLINDGNWHHLAVVVTRATNNIKLYVDGQVQANVTNTLVSTFSVSNTYSLQIGVERNSTTFFNGSIDEVRLWNIARTQCDINAYMNCEIPTNANGLCANYHFNQGLAGAANPTVTTLMDATSNANNGTLQNFALTGNSSNWIAPGGVVSGFTTALAPPDFTATSLSPCAGNTIMLSSTGATSFTWSAGVTDATPFTPTANASYTYTGTNSVTTCSNTAIASVTVNSNPTVTAVSNVTTTLCSGQSATLSASGASTYVWNTTATTAVIVISPTVTTSYTVTGTGANGCQNTATVTQNVSNCTGIAVNQQEQPLNIYPNPTSGNFMIRLSTDANMQISDLSGRTVYSGVLQKGEYKFDLSSYQNGIYFVQIRGNELMSTYKLVKQ